MPYHKYTSPRYIGGTDEELDALEAKRSEQKVAQRNPFAANARVIDEETLKRHFMAPITELLAKRE